MKKIIPLFGITILFLTGCLKTLDFDLDFEGEKIVVRGTISPQDGIIIQVSHTLNPAGTYFLDSLDIFLDNAVVKLYENDTLLKQIAYSGEGGFYNRKDLNLKVGVAYHLTVEAEGYPSIKTQKISIPQLPETTFDFIGQEAAAARININLKDDSATSYYQIVVEGTVNNDSVNLNNNLVGSYEQWEICGVIETRNNTYVKDNCFKDKTFLFPILIDVEYFLTPPDSSTFILESVKAEEVIVRFRSTTKEIYDFVLTTNVPEGIDNAFREPDITFSNVIGGHGYFSAYQEVIYTHKL